MATKNKNAVKPTASSVEEILALLRSEEISSVSVSDVVRKAMYDYGIVVILARSIPCLYDGLKPSSRSVLWAMANTTPTTSNVPSKSARVVGEAIGKYSPHGDSSSYGALVTMTQMPFPLIEGVGNFGNLVSTQAAMRYTNVRWYTAGASAFDSAYMRTAHMVPNYDGNFEIPAYIPMRLPYLFLAGASGVAVGVTTRIPAFTPQSLLPVMADILDARKMLPLEELAERLEFSDPYGGRVDKTPANMEALVRYLGKSSGAIRWSSEVEVNDETKTITLRKYAPDVDPRKVLDWAKEFDLVQSASAGNGKVGFAKNSGGALVYDIRVKKSVSLNEFHAFAKQVETKTSTSVTYFNRVVLVNPDPNNHDGYDSTILTDTIPNLMMAWLKYRVNLEVQMLTHLRSDVDKKRGVTQLTLLAANNLPVVMRALQSSDPRAHLMKALKLTEDQADLILDRKVRQLQALDVSKLQADIDRLTAALAQIDKKLKAPAKEVAKFLRRVAEDCYPINTHTGVYQVGIPKSSVKVVDEVEETQVE